MSDLASIEVFQDLTIWPGQQRLENIRAALIGQTKTPWRHAPEREAGVGSNEFAAFECSARESFPSVGLILWRSEGCFRVSNIVPREHGQLTYAQYNAALESFFKLVVEPVAKTLDLKVETTKPRVSPTDWMSQKTAQSLSIFSSCANKSTGASHPYDEERWLAFILDAYQDEHDAGAYLARWLIEAEHWPEDVAHDLVGQYEFAMHLLARYDRTR
ncbi:hypothetical protein ACFPN1_12125 [Lysobacter yangpyeongensis]|uniref:Uncharacterized protein n=1 Tax=Lysobacter yangpyeongensis TaxID=346182 RepID=A0ABW0SQB7_9GAMM